MDKHSLIGVVTVTYNSGRVIDDFMMSILKQTYEDFILYVVDNASSDDTLRRLAEYRDDRIVPIPNEVNVGVAEGNNIGIRAAQEDGCGSVLLINNDTVFEPNLISELADGLREHECDMIVPKILFFDDPTKIWCAGGYFNALRGSGSHFGLGRKDDGQFDLARTVDYSPTCCMLIRCEVFDRIGLMDASYFLYFDDTDFCLRAYRSGVKLWYLSSAQLLHKVSSLTGGTSVFTIRYITRNHVYYLLKHYPRWQIFLYCPAFYVYILGKYLFLSRRPMLFWAAQKAFWEGIVLFVSNLRRSKAGLEPTGVL
jgi:GT2 family glycosyltransferase